MIRADARPIYPSSTSSSSFSWDESAAFYSVLQYQIVPVYQETELGKLGMRSKNATRHQTSHIHIFSKKLCHIPGRGEHQGGVGVGEFLAKMTSERVKKKREKRNWHSERFANKKKWRKKRGVKKREF